MAGKSEKKLAARNSERKNQFLIAVLVAILVHVGVTQVYPYNSSAEWYFGIFAIIVAVIGVGLMVAVANRGGDLDMEGGVSDVLKDVTITAIAVLILSTTSAYWHALWLWLVGLATYKVWGYLKPYMFPEPDGSMDPSTKKRMDKRQRQAELQARRAKGK
eukprot:m.451787 g.451787  ORF g.451787 m.451787 type:complete len:160 (+) comp20209_c0_seq1:82-561(+)